MKKIYMTMPAKFSANVSLNISDVPDSSDKKAKSCNMLRAITTKIFPPVRAFRSIII